MKTTGTLGEGLGNPRPVVGGELCEGKESHFQWLGHVRVGTRTVTGLVRGWTERPIWHSLGKREAVCMFHMWGGWLAVSKDLQG